MLRSDDMGVPAGSSRPKRKHKAADDLDDFIERDSTNQFSSDGDEEYQDSEEGL